MMNVLLDACMHRGCVYFSTNGDVPQEHSATAKTGRATALRRQPPRERGMREWLTDLHALFSRLPSTPSIARRGRFIISFREDEWRFHVSLSGRQWSTAFPRTVENFTPRASRLVSRGHAEKVLGKSFN
jgi:hypothetical protein